MNRALLLATALFLGAGPLSHSQAPVADPAARLKLMKATNDALLQKQAETIKALDDLQKNAEQLKTFGKRS